MIFNKIVLINILYQGIHLLNHAIRKCYNKENAIIQTNSYVKNNIFKLEFKFSESLTKPSLDDLKKIEQCCSDLIEKSLNIYVSDGQQLIEDGTDLNYPLRKLNDVLYPSKVRVVSIGTEWKNFTNENVGLNGDFSAELCCGTHASNTKELKKISISSFNVVGDSSFEIDASTADFALEMQTNDKKVTELMSEILKIDKERKTNEKSMSSLEILTIQNKLAKLLLEIESIFKKENVSYLVLQKVKKDSCDYRPSKYKLQNLLKKYFEEELVEDSKQASNAAVISSISPNSSISIKFLAFDTILNSEEVLNVIRKIQNIHPVLIIYNKFRGDYFFYSTGSIDQNKEIKSYFDSAQRSILSQNSGASLKQSTEKCRIIKCPSTLNEVKLNESYFTF